MQSLLGISYHELAVPFILIQPFPGEGRRAYGSGLDLDNGKILQVRCNGPWSSSVRCMLDHA